MLYNQSELDVATAGVANWFNWIFFTGDVELFTLGLQAGP